MTTPSITADTLAPEAPVPQTGPAPEAPPNAPAPPVAEEDDRDRRRKKILLLFLLGLLTALLLFALWYLLFRKPISELPIPVVPTAKVPAYQYSVYGASRPNGVAVSPDGSRIYVTQTGGGLETLMLDSKGTKLGILKPPSTITDQASQYYVAVDPVSGDVYATDRTAGQVYVYGADGAYKRRLEPGPQYQGWQPLGIGFDSKGDLFVGDVGGQTDVVHEFGPDGKLIRDLGSGILENPNGIAVDDGGNVYVADTGHGRLVVFDSNGVRHVTVERGASEGNLGLPIGVAIDDQGQVHVADTTAQRVQLYRTLTPSDDRSLTYLSLYGEQGSTDGAFEFPKSVAVDARGRVYVADWGNDRIQVWSY